MGGPYTLFVFGDTDKKTTEYDTFDRALFAASKVDKCIDLVIRDVADGGTAAHRTNGIWYQHCVLQEFANKYSCWSIYQRPTGRGIIIISQNIRADYSKFLELQIEQDKGGNYLIFDASLHSGSLTPKMAVRLSEGLNIASEICLALQPKEMQTNG